MIDLLIHIYKKHCKTVRCTIKFKMAANTDGNTRVEYMQKRSLKILLHFLEENDACIYPH